MIVVGQSSAEVRMMVIGFKTIVAPIVFGILLIPMSYVPVSMCIIRLVSRENVQFAMWKTHRLALGLVSNDMKE